MNGLKKQKMIVEKYVKEKQKLDISGTTLLSVEEARKLPEKLREYGNQWWLRSPGHNPYITALVRNSGYVSSYGDFVDFSTVFVRPALKISNLSSSNFKIGDQFELGGVPFEIISNDMAFCLEDIGRHCFREDSEAKDANVYEKSDVKKYIDDWFESVKNENKK